MTRRALLLAALTMLGVGLLGGATFAGEEGQAGAVPAELLKRVPPRYPAKAVEHGEEGWVDLRFTITPEGTTSDIRVVAAYPRGVFERSAINALGKWVYAPRKENRAPVPQSNNRIVLSFALSDRYAIRPELAPAFAAATDAINNEKWDDATKSLSDIAKSSRALSLYESAVLEELRGRLDFAQGKFTAAADCFGRALAANNHLAPDARAEMTELLVMSSLNGRDFARGVQAFDQWNPPQGWDTRNLRRAVETAREALTTGRQVALPRLSPDDE